MYVFASAPVQLSLRDCSRFDRCRLFIYYACVTLASPNSLNIGMSTRCVCQPGVGIMAWVFGWLACATPCSAIRVGLVWHPRLSPTLPSPWLLCNPPATLVQGLFWQGRWKTKSIIHDAWLCDRPPRSCNKYNQRLAL